MRYALVGLAQVATLALVFILWRRAMPIVGFTGLAIWAAFFYWLTHRLQRAEDARFFEELRRRAPGAR
jgi:uncharacterized membrane protein